MQLVEEGKIDIEAPVSSYLDSLPEAWKKVTIRQLMGHVSGLPDITDTLTDELVSTKGEDSAWMKVKTLPLFFPAGERFNYNTTNYLLLGKIIDKLNGQSFVKFIQHRQLDVVNMQQTTFGNSFDVTPKKAPTYTYYKRDEKGEFVKQDHLMQTYETFPAFLLTDAGMFSTAAEMGRWIIALQQGKLLKNKGSIDSTICDRNSELNIGPTIVSLFDNLTAFNNEHLQSRDGPFFHLSSYKGIHLRRY